VVEPAKLRREAPTTADEQFDLAAQRLANRREDEFVRQRLFGCQDRPWGVGLLVLDADARGPLEDPLFRARLAGLLADAVVDLLVDAGHARRRRRADDAEVLLERVRTLSVGDTGTAREQDEVTGRPLEDVRQRQIRHRQGLLVQRRDVVSLVRPWRKALPDTVDVRPEIPVS